MSDQNATPGFGDDQTKDDWTIRITASKGDGAYAWQEVAPVQGADGMPVLQDGRIQWSETGRHGTLEEHAAWELNNSPRVPLGIVVHARRDGLVPTLYFQAEGC